MRLVLDTDVLLSVLRSPAGASRIVVLAAHTGVVRLVATPAMLFEHEAVLTRPQHLAAIGVSAAELDVFLDGYAGLVEQVRVHFQTRPVAHDPNDDFLVEAAANGRADAIVTFNTSDISEGARRLGVEALSPRQVLELLQWRPSDEMQSRFRLLFSKS